MQALQGSSEQYAMVAKRLHSRVSKVWMLSRTISRHSCGMLPSKSEYITSGEILAPCRAPCMGSLEAVASGVERSL